MPGKDFGKVEGIVRAKRKPYIPVVLSREEIDKLIGFMKTPYDLIAKLLYGWSLRLSECLSLRVNNFNFTNRSRVQVSGFGLNGNSPICRI